MVNVRRVRVKSLVSKTLIGGDYVINPYVGCPHKCIYCYASCINRNGKERSEAWGDFLDVKVPAAQIDLAKVFRKRILFSSMTDAYNPYEKKAQVTREIIRYLIPSEAKLLIITKSSLVTRDIDLFKKFPYVKVVFSFSSLDDGFRRQAEPYASSPADKLRALRELKGAGVATGVFVAPIFPGITDTAAIIDATSSAVNRITFDTLNLRPQNIDAVLGFIRNTRPHLSGMYDDIYLNKNRAYWARLRREIKERCEKAGVRYGIFF